MEREFTTGWFLGVEDLWKERVLPYLKDGVRYLEIGSFEGRSVLFVLDNAKSAHATCIDPFDGHDGAYLSNHPMGDVQRRFYANTEPYRSQVRHIHKSSVDGIKDISTETFDVIYIDGDHSATGVFWDCMNTWPLLSDKGLMIIDDYGWKDINETESEINKGIHAFLDLVKPDGLLINEKYSQVYLRKEKTKWE